MGPMVQQMQSTCPQCHGQGKTFKTKKSKEIIEIHIEKGMKSGQKIPFRGMADESNPDIEPGDLIIILKQKENEDTASLGGGRISLSISQASGVRDSGNTISKIRNKLPQRKGLP
mmetsp:Transcript_9188/g.7651  ORF Transcript_9188/g.7651 Transcript_9188/m.7651 type:complete len:115 (-) Transcript_9188:27-371(-)